jgi:anti-sigma-K factor RskA
MTETHLTNSTSQDCDRLQELLPAYELGIADADERQLVERLLAECPESAALVAEQKEYQEIADQMLFSAPIVEPPPHLLANLLRETAPQAPPAALPGPEEATRTGRNWRWPAAAVVLLLGLNVFSLIQITNLQTEQNELAVQVNRQTSIMTLFARDELTRFELHDVREETGISLASGVVLCNPWETVAVVHAENFPPLSPDNRYQVWLWRDDERTSAGIMEVDATGSGTYVFEAPDAMGTYHYVRIAPVLPVGSQPTGPVVIGALYEPG